MSDESRKAMIEYALKEYAENKRYSCVYLEGHTPHPDIHQISNFKLIDGTFILHKSGKKETAYPLSAVTRIEFPEA